ncbi:transcriptional regulator, AraC family [Sphingobacterium spiritivorum ATCC 33300]|uniref:Transcriptional regulator, AraC family n=1 Tax=Sphingobacterium spiritivorum ATCC 33300 TaxID=525372 RepID=C2FU87_SPHSI|nr:AraC family transcriptional regulator [Sphingobacterium spiritivorum]EEI93465.1 transcriptional regulator, AraC family [Sphingobacterium spiritivorum ATCC 33300]QQS95811.1 helix-turn-helix transcriptional regulator [Sphingobacterium spiritivorum]
MLIKSKIEELDEWLFIEEIPDLYIPDKPLVEKRVEIKRDPITMTNFQLSTSGLFILHTNMRFDQPVHIYTEVEGEVITSQFIFYKSIDSKSQYGMSRHNIRYIPTVKSSHEVKTGVDYSYFIAVISKEYYLNLIKRDSLLHRDFVKNIEKGHYTSFAEEDLMATYEMQHTIDELLTSKKTGEIRRLHTESRIVELLMYQFEQYNEQGTPNNDLFNEDDIYRLEMARQILEQRIANPPTQKELASEVMMSESKLRKDFKEYFSVTIHDYLTRVRMEKARILLLAKQMTVYEVALLTGFGHQNNFSSAFKKYYGISPGELKT